MTSSSNALFFMKDPSRYRELSAHISAIVMGDTSKLDFMHSTRSQ